MERLILAFVAFACITAFQATYLPAERREVTSTHVIVNWYDTERELQIALDDSTIVGTSQCEMRPDFNTSFCELWLVRPTSLDDAYNFDTIGHEFYHALVGDFHH